MSDTLILNADAQPVSLLPLSTVNWQEAIRYMVLEKARVLEWHEDWIVHSATWETRVPAILILNDYYKKNETCSCETGIPANTVVSLAKTTQLPLITFILLVRVVRVHGSI